MIIRSCRWSEEAAVCQVKRKLSQQWIQEITACLISLASCEKDPSSILAPFKSVFSQQQPTAFCVLVPTAVLPCEQKQLLKWLLKSRWHHAKNTKLLLQHFLYVVPAFLLLSFFLQIGMECCCCFFIRVKLDIRIWSIEFSPFRFQNRYCASH